MVGTEIWLAMMIVTVWISILTVLVIALMLEVRDINRRFDELTNELRDKGDGQ